MVGAGSGETKRLTSRNHLLEVMAYNHGASFDVSTCDWKYYRNVFLFESWDIYPGTKEFIFTWSSTNIVSCVLHIF